MTNTDGTNSSMDMTAPASSESGGRWRRASSITTRALATTALLLLSACSKPSSTATSTAPAAPSSAASATAGPCSLITQADAETALGKGAVITPTSNPRTGMDECRIKPGQAPGIVEIIILMHPTTATGWDMVKKSLMEKPAPGLGDDAFVGRFIGYNVRKGNRYIQVFGPMNNEDAANDKATRYLAERASSRL